MASPSVVSCCRLYGTFFILLLAYFGKETDGFLRFFPGDSRLLELKMPDVNPRRETYYCTSMPMNPWDHEYIVEFIPNATKKVVHHILIYGCESPGYAERDTPRVVWNCGEMSGSNSDLKTAGVCKSGFHILYAWAMDAPKLALPPGVGFKVGLGTGINYLVLQVHYGDHEFGQMRDNSGITLKLLPSTTTEVNKRAGVLLLGTGGSIPQGSLTHMETACQIGEDIVIHPFGFRTHTHKLGTAVSGWRIRNGDWTLIGKHDPQEPQMFYPVKDESLVITKSDVVAARCTMNNTRDHDVEVGTTGNDEMCNFYIMYYVNGDQLLGQEQCFSAGPPYYYWTRDLNVPQEIEKEASQL